MYIIKFPLFTDSNVVMNKSSNLNISQRPRNIVTQSLEARAKKKNKKANGSVLSLPWQTSGRTRLCFQCRGSRPQLWMGNRSDGVRRPHRVATTRDNARRWRRSGVKVCRVADIVERKTQTGSEREKRYPGSLQLLCNSNWGQTNGLSSVTATASTCSFKTAASFMSGFIPPSWKSPTDCLVLIWTDVLKRTYLALCLLPPLHKCYSRILLKNGAYDDDDDKVRPSKCLEADKT